MQKIFLITSVFFLAGQLISCSDEEAPVATVSFSSQGTTIGEGDGSVAIGLTLDRAPSNDLVVNYTMTGSAQLNDDYTAAGSVTIVAGATEASIEVTVIDDNFFDYDEEILEVFGESVQITLSGISGNGILSEAPAQLVHLLVIEENDPLPVAMRIDLTWDSGDGTAGDVDMDLILWYDNPSSPGDQIAVASSLQIGTAFEAIEIPTIAPDGEYGLTLRYFEGTSDNLEFTVKFSVADGTTLPGGAPSLSYVGTYSLVNVNGDEGGTVKVEQTFEKQGSSIQNISDIEIPVTSSRQRIFTGIPPARK